MRLSIELLCLPASLLQLIASYPSPARPTGDTRNEPQRRYDNVPHMKYGRVDSPHRRRELEAIQAHLDAGHEPVRVRKMTEDEGEMFFPEYWGFEVEPVPNTRASRSGFEEDDRRLLANSSAEICMRPSFSVHRFEGADEWGSEEAEVNAVEPRAAGNRLRMRGFQCPSNTNACTNILQPNYCCPAGEICISVNDTGLGPVGCCPSEATCSGVIAGCAPGNTQCVQSLGGACCISGFSCFDVGCISNVIVTMTSTIGQTSTTSTVPASTSIASVTPSVSVITVIASTTPSVSVVTVIASTTPAASTLTVTNTITASPTLTASAPVKGTTVSATSDAALLGNTPITIDSCPTGFYACSAYYPGAGCCRIGRDCTLTSCPTTASVTIVSSGKTIVVPLVPDATTLATASCAGGWAACAATAGGGCCPSNFVCGTDSSCTTNGVATATVAKETPAVGSVGTKADIKTGLAVMLIGAVGFAMMI